MPGNFHAEPYGKRGLPYSTYLSYSVDVFDSTPADDRLNWATGHGPTLHWHRTRPAAAKVAAALVEADPYDNYGYFGITVSPNNPSDIVAKGTSVAGKVGAEVSAYYQDVLEQDTAAGKTWLVLPYSLADGADYAVTFVLKITSAGAGQGTVVGQGGVGDPVTSSNTVTVTGT